MMFRKKPVIVEAFRTGWDYDHDCMIMQWCGGVFHSLEDDDSLFEIPTPEGYMKVRSGDWVIKGVHGEFYPCKPDIFAETYERVETKDV